MSDRPDSLFHYTHPLHLVDIIKEKALWTTESNISLQSQHYGPDVVWAVDGLWMPEVVGEDHLPHGLTEPKQRVTVEFKTPKRAYKWTEWEWTQRMDPLWKMALVNAAGGWEAADRWWVVDHPVISRHWVEILADGKRIWPQG